MSDSIKFYTYIYRDPSRNNEPIYVGKGSRRRAYSHLKKSNRHPFIQRLQKMKNNNISPTIEIINALDESHSFFLEECLIEIYGRKDLGKGTLLNLTNGGEGVSGFKHSQDHKDFTSRLGKENVILNRGIFSLTKSEKIEISSLGGKAASSLGLGFKAGYVSSAGKKGGIISGNNAKDNKTGIHSISIESEFKRQLNSKTTKAIRAGKASPIRIIGEPNNV